MQQREKESKKRRTAIEGERGEQARERERDGERVFASERARERESK